MSNQRLVRYTRDSTGKYDIEWTLLRFMKIIAESESPTLSTHCKVSIERNTLQSTPICTTKQIILQLNNKSVSKLTLHFEISHIQMTVDVNTCTFFP